LLEHPNRYAGANDPRLAAANVGTALYSREGIAEVTDNEVKQLSFSLRGSSWKAVFQLLELRSKGESFHNAVGSATLAVGDPSFWNAGSPSYSLFSVSHLITISTARSPAYNE